jgi:hypothetical protein
MYSHQHPQTIKNKAGLSPVDLADRQKKAEIVNALALAK